MKLHLDLLEQAKQLASQEKKRPRQASLRRAVSSAYYALFHLLCTETSRMFVKDRAITASLCRTLNHGEMKKASQRFVGDQLPASIKSHAADLKHPSRLPLKQVARAFIDLQEARHEADYDLAKTFSRVEVRRLVARASQAFLDWESIRKDSYARLYLACFLLWDHWDKVR